MSDTNPDLAAQEVDDELRRDEMNRLWKKYGKFVIGGAVGIVLAVGGTQLYKYQVRSTQESNSAKFSGAMEKAEADGADAAAIWSAVAPELDAGYAALAELRAASALAAAGKAEAAIAAYDALAASTDGDIILREYAQLRAGLLVVDKTGDLDGARSRFTVLAVAEKPWYYSAVEQLAFLDMKQGDTETAYERFATLADDAGTPQSIGTRARNFRDMLERQLPQNNLTSPEDAAPTQPESSHEG